MKAYNESRLTDLLIEFDEMGFCPTTVCPHPEQYAIEWKEQIVKEIQKLQAENAELRERLDKAVGLPCEMPNTIYTVIKNCASCKHYNVGWAECRAPATANFDCESTHRTCFNQDIIDDECKKHLYIVEVRFELGFLDDKTWELKPQYFIDLESAEARRKELQGGEQ